jgi:hypothetical protein
MQREIDDLRRQLKEATKNNTSGPGRLELESAAQESSEAASSTKSRHLGDTELSGTTVDSLFKE